MLKPTDSGYEGRKSRGYYPFSPSMFQQLIPDIYLDIDGLEQEKRNSNAQAMELRLSLSLTNRYMTMHTVVETLHLNENWMVTNT